MTAPSGEEKTYSYTYDGFGRLLSVTAPDGTTAGQTYDAYGNITGVISPMGGVTGYTPLDSVRGMFTEGKAVYEGSGFMAKTHCQICVINPNCIKGYFLPREIDKNYPLP